MSIPSASLYEAIVNQAPSMIFVLDEKGTILFANDNAARGLGKEASAIVQRPLGDFFSETMLLPFVDHMKEVFRSGVPFWNQMILIPLESDERWVEATLSPVRDEHGAIVAVIVYCLDISEHKRAEHENARIQAQLLHSSKLASIGTLAAGVAHEINNPLSIARGYMELIGDTVRQHHIEDAILEDAFKKQDDAVERIATIVNGLRTYARPDTDITEDVDLIRIAQDTVALCQNLLKRDNIVLEMRLNPLPLILGNIGKLQQVLMNLITNARDSVAEAKRASGKIIIETEKTDSEILMRITDNGLGIPDIIRSRIFDPFFTTKSPGLGTGLGLSIVHSIIQTMGGRIRVDSTTDVGTTFTLSWPADSITSDMGSDPQSKPTSSAAKIALKAAVLVVDDEEAIRLIVTHHLSKCGVTVFTVANGQEALDFLSSQSVDAIITDLKMPIMGGLDFLKTAKAKGIRTPILVMTGGIITDYTQDERDLIRQLASAYLRKPFSGDVLVQALETVLKKR